MTDVTPVADAGPAPERRVGIRSPVLTCLVVLAGLYTLYFARPFLLPLTVAVLLDLLLSPVVRGLKRARVPSPVGAALVILGLLGALGLAGYGLAEPAQSWLARGPSSLREAQHKLHSLKAPLEWISRTAEQVEQAAAVPDDPQRPEVVLKGPSVTSQMFGTTRSLIAGALQVIILAYFLLAADDLFLEKLVKGLPQFGDKRKAVAIARQTETAISSYLFTAALVNLGAGLSVAAAMTLIGMPNALLWGGLTALAEFVPYLGALGMVITLSLAALVTFDSLGHALLVPAAYLAINFLQVNVVSPKVFGHRLALNPVAILVGLAFWWRIWGLPGALVAVPVIATLKICCDHIERFRPVGEFLGR
ncbi:MAG TPA: AI-2E family transporter [Gemmatimonadales bacterium]|nr:AI-2E family transporter [Gemmatimonadales bacterium]